MANDLLSGRDDPPKKNYDANSIQVLDDMEHVRLRPGMYIGGKDDRAMHHMVAEIIDNSMDEAVAGHATWIEVELDENRNVSITDNGRGIPTDPHPSDPSKSTLEIIFCTLNAGGKFSGENYETSGGLNGVGSSVVNALSDHLRVEVARNKELVAMEFQRGAPTTALEKVGASPNRRGTKVTFHPDPEIFGSLKLKPAKLFTMARSKAYLFSGVEIRWKTAIADGDTPMEAKFHFPGGLSDFLNERLEGATTHADKPFAGTVEFREKFGEPGKVDWSINWTPTITRDDLMTGGCALVSVFIRDPQYVGQTKDRLSNENVQKMVEGAVRDHFDNWLAADTKSAGAILDFLVLRAEERMRRKQEKETARKSATKKLRLPGKLTDCTSKDRAGTELFIVEGDSANPQRAGGCLLKADHQRRNQRPLRSTRRRHGH